MIKKIQDIYERWLMKRYLYLGSRWGDMQSYYYLGKAMGIDNTRKKYKRIERKLRGMGYYCFPNNSDFIYAGGYGYDLKVPKKRKRRCIKRL